MTQENREKMSEQTEAAENQPIIDRRRFLGRSSGILLSAALVARAQAQGAQDIEKIEKAKRDASASDAGPENQPLKDADPNTFLPPATDHGEVETFWNSFSTAHRRIQEGGWSRQVTGIFQSQKILPA